MNLCNNEKHDLDIVGRVPNGGCRGCKREWNIKSSNKMRPTKHSKVRCLFCRRMIGVFGRNEKNHMLVKHVDPETNQQCRGSFDSTVYL